MALDLDYLRGWIGREEIAEDVATPRLVDEFRATFAPHLAPVGDDEAPLGLHWCLAPTIRPMAELGPDGHPERGGFLPPVPLPRRMWAGGQLDTRGPLRIGESVRRRSRIADVSAKHGRSGALCFVTVRHDYETDRGVAASERHDIVYREASGPGPATSAEESEAAEESKPAQAEWHVETSPVFLFRYSALTFNGHRIHYDLPYVTGAEGYPGLVVHGPIQATLLLNLVATTSGRAPATFAYRGLSPLTAGAPFRVAAARMPEGGLRAWTESRDGPVCMEARDHA